MRTDEMEDMIQNLIFTAVYRAEAGEHDFGVKSDCVQDVCTVVATAIHSIMQESSAYCSECYYWDRDLDPERRICRIKWDQRLRGRDAGASKDHLCDEMSFRSMDPPKEQADGE